MDPSWYFDTGATDHVTPDISKLTIANDYTGDDKLQVGNGKHLSISHVGSSLLPNLSLPSVFIVLNLTKNLLSVSKLTRDNDVFMEFWPTHCFVKNFQGQTLLQGDISHGLYRLPPVKTNLISFMVVLVYVLLSMVGINASLIHMSLS